jgi:hypothetical protein
VRHGRLDLARRALPGAYTSKPSRVSIPKEIDLLAHQKKQQLLVMKRILAVPRLFAPPPPLVEIYANNVPRPKAGMSTPLFSLKVESAIVKYVY